MERLTIIVDRMQRDSNLFYACSWGIGWVARAKVVFALD